MEPIRKPYQGMKNILRFNAHSYVAGIIFVSIVFITTTYVGGWQKIVLLCLGILALVSMILSLLVSWWVYDRSALYSLKWLPDYNLEGKKLINIHAGFDETSTLLQQKFPRATLDVLDFYDPALHTELSIKKARKAYPPYPGTRVIQTSNVAIAANDADLICCIFSAHEIRNEAERIEFLRALRNGLSANGRIILTEHQRDLPNFLAYNVGFFHFHSPLMWKKNIQSAGLHIEKIIRITPLISTYILTAHGNSA